MHIDSNAPAFPNIAFDDKGYITTSGENQGITKREYFAAKAMQGLISAEMIDKLAVIGKSEAADNIISVRALKLADALIQELNK